jgi:hypothetical protein
MLGTRFPIHTEIILRGRLYSLGFDVNGIIICPASRGPSLFYILLYSRLARCRARYALAVTPHRVTPPEPSAVFGSTAETGDAADVSKPRPRLRRRVTRSSSPSQRASTTEATPLPIILTVALPMLMKRSTPKIRAIPATGMVGITINVPTSAMNDAPCTPLAPLEVSTATAKMVNCCPKVRCVLVA